MKVFTSKSKPGFYVNGISELPEDAQEISAELWQQLLQGQETGKAINFNSEPPELVEYVRTKEDEIAEAETVKAELRLEADTAIAPLEDAVDLGLATDDEVSRLNEWRKFRIILNRIDTSTAPDITWPTQPV